MRFARKHIQIIETIIKNGKYKPAYSDQEPATVTLIKLNIVEWNGSFTGLILTEEGKLRANEILTEYESLQAK